MAEDQNIKTIEEIIKNAFPDNLEGKTDAWQIVDNIISAKFVKQAMDRLPEESTKREFLEIYVKSPDDETAVFGYLEKKIGIEGKNELQEKMKNISSEILDGIFKPGDETTTEIRSEGRVPVK